MIDLAARGRRLRRAQAISAASLAANFAAPRLARLEYPAQYQAINEATTTSRADIQKAGDKVAAKRWFLIFGAVCAAAIAVVLAILGAFGGLAESDLPGPGIALMVVGIIVTCGLGIGLMALIFYSERSGQDEIVYRIDQARESARSGQDETVYWIEQAREQSARQAQRKD